MVWYGPSAEQCKQRGKNKQEWLAPIDCKTQSESVFRHTSVHIKVHTPWWVGGTWCALHTEGNAHETEDLRLLYPPVREVTLQAQGPRAAVGEGQSTSCTGRTWPMAMAVVLLCVDPSQSRETGKVWGLSWCN